MLFSGKPESGMRILTLAFAGLLVLTMPGTAAPPPTVTDAKDGIFAAFQTRPLVGIGEWHGLAQELDFYSVLLRDPRFAGEVGNVVLEVGGAAHQDIVDRYVNGEDVPYAELRKVWTDVVGWFPTVTAIGSINIYATVRAVNQTLPPERRIKVWLGEPPIDWAQIKTKADWQLLAEQRDSHPAQLIEREILAKGKKALVIYGSGHLILSPGYEDLRTLVAAKHPEAFFIVMPHIGFGQKSCTARFAKFARNWPVPALVTPVVGSSLENEVYRPGCSQFAIPPKATAQQLDLTNRNNSGLTSDALLYLGPRDRFVTSPNMPDLYLDTDFRAELERRSRLILGTPIKGYTAERNPAVNRPYSID
jgi:hypothetical protein